MSHRVGLPLLLVGLIGAWYYPFALHSPAVGFMADDALYLLMADALSPFHSGEARLLEYVMQTTLFPPLFPLVLGLLGGGSDSLAESHVITTTLFLGSLLSLYWFAERISGQVWIAVSSMVVMACTPSSLYMSTEIWSEFQYMLLCLCALSLATGAKPTDRKWWLVAVLIGLAAVTRAVGISLVIAFGLFTLVRPPANRAWLWVLAAGPLVLWQLRRTGFEEGASYLNALTERVSISDLAGVLGGIVYTGEHFWWAWLGVFNPARSEITVGVCAAALALGFVGLALRLRRMELDGLYLVGYLSLVLLWQYPAAAERLLYSVTPMLVVYSAFAAAHLARWATGTIPRFASLVPLVCLWLVTVPSALSIAYRYLASTDPQVGDYIHTRYWLRNPDNPDALRDVQTKRAMVSAMRRIQDLVTESDCVYSYYIQATMLYSRRVSLPPPAALPVKETCRYYLILSTSHIEAQLRRLPQRYRIVHVEHPDYDPKVVAAVLVEFPFGDYSSGLNAD